MKLLSTVVTIVALALIATAVVTAQSDPRIGTWKLDSARSKFSPGPGPTSETRTYEQQDGAIMVTVELVDANGKHMTNHYNTTADGKDYPLGEPNGPDTNAVKQLGPNSWEGTAKKDGKVVGTTRATISKDGKTFTLNSKGTNGQGQATSNLAVFDKE